MICSRVRNKKTWSSMANPLVLKHLRSNFLSPCPLLNSIGEQRMAAHCRQHPLAHRRQMFLISIQEAPGSRHFTRSDRFRTARSIRVAQILSVFGHHADEGSIDGRSAEEHGMVGQWSGVKRRICLCPRREGMRKNT